jgi:hypothetical protein
MTVVLVTGPAISTYVRLRKVGQIISDEIAETSGRARHIELRLAARARCELQMLAEVLVAKGDLNCVLRTIVPT